MAPSSSEEIDVRVPDPSYGGGCEVNRTIRVGPAQRAGFINPSKSEKLVLGHYPNFSRCPLSQWIKYRITRWR